MSLGPIHHVAVVVASIDAALPRYERLFGLRPEAPAFVFESQRVRLCFLATGPAPAARIELVEPIDGESGVARFLAARGEGLHHVCLLTADLPRDLAALAAKGHDVRVQGRQGSAQSIWTDLSTGHVYGVADRRDSTSKAAIPTVAAGTTR